MRNKHDYRAGRCFRILAGVLFLVLISGCGGTASRGHRTFLDTDLHPGSSSLQQQDMPERIILNLTEEPWSSQAVTWRTISGALTPQAQIACLAESSDLLETTAQTFRADTQPADATGARKAFHHSVVFTSLSPGTLYAYRVGDGQNWSEWNQFRTAQKIPSPFTFIYFGDPQEQVLSMCSRIFRTAYKTAPYAAFWLFVGDLVDNGDRDEEWADLFDAFGWIPRMTPVILLPGNHEYPDKRYIQGQDYKLFPLWRPHFTLPENGPAGLEETVYFIDYQGVRFVMLNGNEQLEKQARWLDGILKENPNGWTIVSIHQPIYSIAQRRKGRESVSLIDLFVPVFDRYSVDLVLQGHDHAYSRTAGLRNTGRAAADEQGTVYIISVCGPKSYRTSDRYNDIMEKSGTDRQLFQVISIDEGRLEYECYDARGALFDSFVLEK